MYCLLHRGIVLPRHVIFHIFVCVYVLVSMCLIYVICFFIIIFIFIKINRTILLTQKNLFFGHVCRKFDLRVLLSFQLIFCHFQPGIAANFFSVSRPSPDLVDEGLISIFYFFIIANQGQTQRSQPFLLKDIVSILAQDLKQQTDLKKLRNFLQNGKYRPKL